MVVRPHALEEHAPALSGPAIVRAPGDAGEGGAAAGLPSGGGATGGLLAAAGGRDGAVSLAALWCAARLSQACFGSARGGCLRSVSPGPTTAHPLRP